MDIAILGTGGSAPTPDRFLASILLKYNGRNILVDCGEGTQVSMKMLKWGFKAIDIICISHGHGDHIYGLPGLLLTIRNSGRTAPLTIIGPKGIEDSIEGLISSVSYLSYDINFIEVSSEKIAIDFSPHSDLIISTLELEHSTPCIGFSFEVPRTPKFNTEKALFYGIPKELWKNLQRGETIVYNGNSIEPQQVLGARRKGIKFSYIVDTRPISNIPNFIKDSDLFICEGTYGSEKDIDKAIMNQHMIFSEAAKLASDGNVKEMILTHFSPAMDEPEIYIEYARKIFPNTNIGYDRLIKKLSF